MYTVYVLSDTEGHYYKGMTNDLERRLREHRLKKTKTTAHMKGLNLVYSEVFDNVDDARKREVYFKTAAGRRFLKVKLGV